MFKVRPHVHRWPAKLFPGWPHDCSVAKSDEGTWCSAPSLRIRALHRAAWQSHCTWLVIFGKTLRNLPYATCTARVAVWTLAVPAAGRLMKICSTQERSIHVRPPQREWRREEGKIRGLQRCTVVSKIRRPTSASHRSGGWRSCTVVRMCQLSGQLQDQSFPSNFKESLFKCVRKQDLEDNNTAWEPWKANKRFPTEAFGRVEHR